LPTMERSGHEHPSTRLRMMLASHMLTDMLRLTYLSRTICSLTSTRLYSSFHLGPTPAFPQISSPQRFVDRPLPAYPTDRLSFTQVSCRSLPPRAASPASSAVGSASVTFFCRCARSARSEPNSSSVGSPSPQVSLGHDQNGCRGSHDPLPTCGAEIHVGMQREQVCCLTHLTHFCRTPTAHARC
jgi:hypothetical protein